MLRTRSLYPSQAILLIAALIPLALAERQWAYVIAAAVAALVGWQRTVRSDRPLLSTAGTQIYVVLAFAMLVMEYVWFVAIPVMALSHFMALVCISKFLQRRSLRDDAQLMILTLLLLVVSAIVSGNLMFPLILLVFLTVGIDQLIRFHRALERSRVDQANAALHGVQPDGGSTPPAPPASAPGICLVVALVGMSVGTAVFVFFPRIGSGMFGHLEGRGGGMTLTGFAADMNFDAVGPVQESDRPAMRVQIEAIGGAVVSSPLYLRGAVLDQYTRTRRGGERGWGWRRTADSAPFRMISIEDDTGLDDMASLLPEHGPHTDGRMIVQRYWLEPSAGRQAHLFTCYPAVSIGEVSAAEIDTVAKSVADQCLRAGRLPRKVVRYTIRTPAIMTPELVAALRAERADSPEPEALPPSPELPRQEEIRALAARVTAGVGSLDDPANRLAFARRIESFLRSRQFTYTLSVPAPGPDPVGDFLLDQRRGYCQHFAAGMVLMCQLSGVPARIVNGYRCDERNPLGGVHIVRARQAHSWVEVYIPGQDWVTFDPTPNQPAPQGPGLWLLKMTRWVDYLQFQWANLVLTYDADLRRGLFRRFEAWLLRPAQNQSTAWGSIVAFVRELFGWRLELSWQDRLLYWVFTLLIVTMAVLIGYVLVVLAWRLANRIIEAAGRRTLRGHIAGDVSFYHYFCRRAAVMGLRRRADQTPAEFAADLAARFPLFEPAPELVAGYYRVVFGGQTLPEEQRGRFEGFVRTLQARTSPADAES